MKNLFLIVGNKAKQLGLTLAKCHEEHYRYNGNITVRAFTDLTLSYDCILITGTTPSWIQHSGVAEQLLKGHYRKGGNDPVIIIAFSEDTPHLPLSLKSQAYAIDTDELFGTKDDLPEIPASNYPKTWDWLRECGVELEQWELDKLIELAEEEINLGPRTDNIVAQSTEALDYIYDLFHNSHEMDKNELHERIGMVRHHIEFSIANLKSLI